MFGWFLIGSYWIYRIYEPNYNPMRGPHCDIVLYTFAFWLVSSVYILLAVTVAFLLIITLLSLVLLHICDVSANADPNANPNNQMPASV